MILRKETIMPELTTSQLAAIMPACPDTESWTPALNAAMGKFEITTAERMAAFLAQRTGGSLDES